MKKSIMKKIFIVTVSILTLLGCKKEQIETANPDTIEGIELTILQPDKHYNLRAIHFIDNQTGFASSYDGKIIKTTDAGSTWDELETNTTVPLYGIDFINSTIGFVVGGKSSCGGNGCIPIGAVILKTTDGGETWKEVTLNLNDKIGLKSVQFINNLVGFAVGNSSILKTIDGGDTWEQTKINNLNGTMQKVAFNSTMNGVIICIGGQIVSTTDKGITWNAASTISTIGSVSISITEDDIIYVSDNSKIQKSSDFGVSWTLLNSTSDNFDINFISQNIGFAVGRGNYSGGDFGYHYGAIFYTIDGGENWIENKNIKETGSLHESSFPTKNQGYIVSSNNIIKVKIE
jgi:photosystem II stability/assembly factor-like uncharacterized protein